MIVIIFSDDNNCLSIYFDCFVDYWKITTNITVRQILVHFVFVECCKMMMSSRRNFIISSIIIIHNFHWKMISIIPDVWKVLLFIYYFHHLLHILLFQKKKHSINLFPPSQTIIVKCNITYMYVCVCTCVFIVKKVNKRIFVKPINLMSTHVYNFIIINLFVHSFIFFPQSIWISAWKSPTQVIRISCSFYYFWRVCVCVSKDAQKFA